MKQNKKIVSKLMSLILLVVCILSTSVSSYALNEAEADISLSKVDDNNISFKVTVNKLVGNVSKIFVPYYFSNGWSINYAKLKLDAGVEGYYLTSDEICSIVHEDDINFLGIIHTADKDLKIENGTYTYENTIPVNSVSGTETFTFGSNYSPGYYITEEDGETDIYSIVEAAKPEPAAKTTVTADTSAVASELKPGDTFTVPVKLADNPGFTSYVLQATYDSDLELTGITAGDVLALSASNIETGIVNATSSTTVTNDGTLFNLAFKVKDGATSGSKQINIGLKDGNTANFCNDENDVSVEFAAGSVNVVAAQAEAEYSAYLNTSAGEVAAGGTYTAGIYLKGKDLVSGDVTLSCENGTIQSISLVDGLKNQGEGSNSKLSFYGNSGTSAVDFTDGAKAAEITVLANKDLAAGDLVTLKITDGNASSGSISDQKIVLGTDSSVSVSAAPKEEYEVIPFAGKYMIIYEGTAGNGNIVKYNGEAMYYSEKYGMWVCLADESPSDISGSSFTEEAGTAVNIDYTGDVNGMNGVTSTDMQIAYDIANAVYADGLTDMMRLAADITGNKAVTANDARNIQCIFHNLERISD